MSASEVDLPETHYNNSTFSYNLYSVNWTIYSEWATKIFKYFLFNILQIAHISATDYMHYWLAHYHPDFSITNLSRDWPLQWAEELV